MMGMKDLRKREVANLRVNQTLYMLLCEHYMVEFDRYMNIDTLSIVNISYHQLKFEYIPLGLKTLQLELEFDQSFSSNAQSITEADLADQIEVKILRLEART
jgi:hypothetical protein